MTEPAAIVLAGGEGRRMGGPKALLIVDGKPLIAAHVERLREIGCRPILVVARAAIAADVRVVLAGVSEALIIEADTESMAASLSLALGHLAPDPARIIVISPVDTLPVARSTLQALLAAMTDSGVQVATPHHGRQGGHPVVVRDALMQPMRRGYVGTLRDLVRSADAQRQRLEIDDAALGAEFDTPAELSALRPGTLPSFAFQPNGSAPRSRLFETGE